MPQGCLAGAADPGSDRVIRGRRWVHGHLSLPSGRNGNGTDPRARWAGGGTWPTRSSTRRCTGGTGRRRPPRCSGRTTSSARSPGRSATDRLHHAFLFCGPRGTGKTSTARILAKMVNCEQGPTAEPCGDVLAVRRDPRGHPPRRRRDRRRQPRRRRGCARAAREGADRAGAGPREGLHHRRGAAAVARGLRRPAEGLRGAAAGRALRARHHRAAQDARHDRRTLASGSTSGASTCETLTGHLQSIAAAEGATLTDSAAHAIARQAEGLVPRRALVARPGRRARRRHDRRRRRRTRCSVRPVARCSTSSPTRSRSATPRASSRSSGGWCQDGQDLRNVTAESLAALPQPAARQDGAGPGRSRRRARRRVRRRSASRPRSSRRASSLACSRLLLAAQNDMRWTTSPRLSLELALVRSTMPETDADPAALARPARTSRTSRQPRSGRRGADRSRCRPRRAGPGALPTTSRPSLSNPLPSAGHRRSVGRCRHRRARGPRRLHRIPAPPTRRRSLAVRRRRDRTGRPAARVVDADARSACRRRRQRRCRAAAPFVAIAARAPVGEPADDPARRSSSRPPSASYDGTTLELAFPPDRKVGPQKVEGKKDELQAALGDLFGVKPDIVCVVREVRDAGGPRERR